MKNIFHNIQIFGHRSDARGRDSRPGKLFRRRGEGAPRHVSRSSPSAGDKLCDITYKVNQSPKTMICAKFGMLRDNLSSQ